MVILRGQAQAAMGNEIYRPGSIHEIIAIVNTSNPARALFMGSSELELRRFGEVRYGEWIRIPFYHTLLPTAYGALIRRALFRSNVIICNEESVWKIKQNEALQQSNL